MPWPCKPNCSAPPFSSALLKIIWVNILLSGDNAVVIGLGLSIPLIIFGSTLMLKLMERFPAIITLGAALLGFVAGEMATTDMAVHEWFETHLHGMDYAVSISCAVLVVVIGLAMARRSKHEPT